MADLVKHSYTRGRSRSFRASLDVATELAAEAGIPQVDALYFMEALGRVILNRTFKGKISGIPGFGVIHVDHQKNRKHYDLHEGKTMLYPSMARVKLWLPTGTTRDLRENAADGGTFREQLQRISDAHPDTHRKKVSPTLFGGGSEQSGSDKRKRSAQHKARA